MNARLVALAMSLVAAAVVLTSVSAARPVAARQRVEIAAKRSDATFVLRPLAPGIVKDDSGVVRWCCWSTHTVMRDGQSILVNDPLATFTGKRGTLAARFRTEWVDAGNNYTVGTSTWRVLRGTGDYGQLTGSGRAAGVWLPRGSRTFAMQGFLGPR